MHRAGSLEESRSLTNDMVTVVQARRSGRKERLETLLSLNQWTLAQILAVKVEEIEQKEDKRCRVATVRSELDDVKRGEASRRNGGSSFAWASISAISSSRRATS